MKQEKSKNHCPLHVFGGKVKLTVFILLFFGIQSFAGVHFAQSQKINLKIEKSSLLDAMKRIENLTDYHFFFDMNIIPRDHEISLDISDYTISQLLNELFKGTGINYKVNKQQIILSKGEKPLPADQPQNKTVSGKVLNSSGDPLPGVAVMIKGTTTGIATDMSGDYTLKNVPENSILVFTFLGMNTIEAPVKGKNTINVRMTEQERSVDEVVVTALGIKREEKSLGYAVSRIKSEDLLKSGNTVNPLEGIYGKAAGVGIAMGSAGPTGSINIKIRGAGGLEPNAKTRPLFVVDGVPIYDENSNMSTRGWNPLNSFDYGTGINDINNEDIASMEILKGAKAAVLYGSAGANGVVLITTKSGAGTRGLGVTASFQYNIDKPVNFIDWQNEYGSGTSVYDTVYVEKDGVKTNIRKMNNSRFQFGPAFDNKPIQFYDGTMLPYRAYPNNFDDLFKSTYTRITSVAISGANDKGDMRVSYTNKDYNGFFKNFWQKSNTLSFHGQMKASKLASFEAIANLWDVKTQNRYPNLGRLVSYGFNRDIDYQRLASLYKDDLGQKPTYDDYGVPASVSASDGYLAMLWNQYENRNNDDKFHMTGTIKSTLRFLPWLYVTTNTGIDYTDWDFTAKEKVDRIIPAISGGKYSFQRKNQMVQNYNGLLNFEKNFMGDKLNVFAFVGAEARITTTNDISSSTQGGLQFPDWYSISASVGVPTTGSSRTKELLYSLLSSASFSWENTYYLELQARQDWSSTLPPENNKYFYPGASLSWLFSNKYKIPYLKFGKLRLSWADVGRGAPAAYYANNAYSAGKIYNSDVTTIGGPSVLFSGSLKPERKREYEIGFNTIFFEEGRLNIDFSYYTNNTYNEIMGVPLSNPTGYSEIRINAGKVKRWGYELAIQAVPVVTKDFRWSVNFTTSNQFSKTVKLYPGIKQKAISGGGSFGVWAEEGKKFGEIKMYDYQRTDNGTRIVNSNGFYTPDDKKLIVAGNVNPNFIGGFGSEFNYKSFRLNLGFDYKFGGTFLSYSNYYLLGNGQIKKTLQYRDEAHGGLAYYIDNKGNRIKTTHNASVPAGNTDAKIYHDGLILPGVMEKQNDDGTTSYVPNDKIITATDYWSTFINDMSTFFQPDYLYKNDYIKLREISLAYTLPKKLVNSLKLQKLVFSVNARNLFYLYKTMPNVDVESTLGSDSYIEYSYLPVNRSYGFRIDVSF